MLLALGEATPRVALSGQVRIHGAGLIIRDRYLATPNTMDKGAALPVFDCQAAPSQPHPGDTIELTENKDPDFHHNAPLTNPPLALPILFPAPSNPEFTGWAPVHRTPCSHTKNKQA